MSFKPNQKVHPNELLCRRWVEQVWNAGREDLIDEMYAERGAAVYPYFVKSQDRLVGREEFKKFYRRVREQFEDISISMTEISAQDERVVSTFIINARKRPNADGSPGESVELKSLCVYKISNGLITEIWNNVEVAKPELKHFRLDIE